MNPLKQPLVIRKIKAAKNKLKKLCEVFWRETVKMNALMKCEKCGRNIGFKITEGHSHHFITKSVRCLEFNLENGIAMCPADHRTYGHKFVHDLRDFMIQKRGQQWYDLLLAIRNGHSKINLFYIKIYLTQEHKLARQKCEDMGIDTTGCLEKYE